MSAERKSQIIFLVLVNQNCPQLRDENMAIVLIHLRRIVLMFSLVFVSELLFEHLLYMAKHQSAFRTTAQLLDPRTGQRHGAVCRWHVQAWVLLYIVYTYTIVCGYPAAAVGAFNNNNIDVFNQMFD